MKHNINPWTYSQTEVDDFFNYDVYDCNLRELGYVNGFWTDSTGKPEFIGLRTSGLFGKTHLVPLLDAQVDPEEGHIYLAYAEDQIKAAPAYGTNEELTDAEEEDIYRYYGIQRRGS